MTKPRRGRLHGFLIASAVLITGVVVLLGVAVGRFFERHLLTYHHAQVAGVVQTQARQHLIPLDFERPEARAGGEVFGAFIAELPAVFRIKVYDRTGRIVWSDEPRLVGRAFPGDAFLAKALAGHVAAVLQTPTRPEHEYELSKRYVAETYVPITLPGSPIPIGVIEAYEDATALAREIEHAQWRIWGVATGTGVFLYLALTWVVWRASINEEAAIRELEARNLELERTNDALHAAQAQLVEKERLAAVGQLAVGLHHAILNPLAGLLGALRLLRHGGLAASTSAQTFEDAEAEIRKIEGLVRRLPGLQRTTCTPYVGHTTMLDLAPSAAEDEPEPGRRPTHPG